MNEAVSQTSPDATTQQPFGGVRKDNQVTRVKYKYLGRKKTGQSRNVSDTGKKGLKASHQ